MPMTCTATSASTAGLHWQRAGKYFQGPSTVYIDFEADVHETRAPRTYLLVSASRSLKTPNRSS